MPKISLDEKIATAVAAAMQATLAALKTDSAITMPNASMANRGNGTAAPPAPQVYLRPGLQTLVDKGVLTQHQAEAAQRDDDGVTVGNKVDVLDKVNEARVVSATSKKIQPYDRQRGDNLKRKADMQEPQRDGTTATKSKTLYLTAETQQQLNACMTHADAPSFGVQFVDMRTGKAIGMPTALKYKPSSSVTADGQRNYMLACDDGLSTYIDCEAGLFSAKMPAGLYMQICEKHPTR